MNKANKSDELKKAVEKDIQQTIEWMREEDAIVIVMYYSKKSEKLGMKIPQPMNVFGNIMNLMSVQNLLKYTLSQINARFERMAAYNMRALQDQKLETATGQDGKDIPN